MARRLPVLLFLNLSIAMHVFSQCAGPITYTATPAPGHGNTYYPGEVVTFCATVNGYEQNLSNWFHGLTIFFGPGWDSGSLIVLSVPPPASGSGNWAYYPNGINSYTTGNHWAPGFYFGTDAGAVNGSFTADSDNPGENYGDYCSPGPCSWTFCFSVQVAITDSMGTSASLSLLPSGDGQSGSWTNGEGGCDGDSTTTGLSSATVGAPVFFVTASQTNVTCFGKCNGAATAVGVNGQPPYAYKWNTIPVCTAATATRLCPGVYTVTVTDSANKVDSISVTITQPGQLTNTGRVFNPVCNGTCTGTVVLQDSGGTAPYSYAWSVSEYQTSSTAYGLCSGPISVTVSDSNSCSVTASYTLTDPPVLTIELVSQTNELCNGDNSGSIAVTDAGGNPGQATFHWSNGEYGPNDTALVANTYHVTVTDTMGCTASATYVLTQPAAHISIGVPVINNVSCYGMMNGSITANASSGTGPLNYSWVEVSDSATFSGATISNLGPGTYNLTVTDSNGCQKSASYNITSPAQMVIDSFTHTNLTCFGASNATAAIYVQGGAGAYQYTWSGHPSDNTFMATDLSAGNTTVIVTDANNCTVAGSVTILQPAQLTLTAVSQQQVSCNTNSGKIVVTASGGTPGSGYNYLWNDNESGPEDSSLTVGQVTVTVTDANSCTLSQTYNITSSSSLTGTPIVTEPRCNGASDGSINANPSGGNPPYSFSWSDMQSAQTAVSLDSGTYTCTITDASGCLAIFTAQVNQPQKLEATTNPAPVKCAGQKTGTISINVQGGVYPYSYAATQDNINFIYTTNGVITDLDTGLYTVLISDSNGCTKTVTAYVPDATPDQYTVTTDSTLCNGVEYNDGSANIMASPNGPYQFSIDDGSLQDTGYFANLSAGAHLILSVNANGCTDTLPIVIYQPLPIEVQLTPDSLVLPLGQSQAISAVCLNAVEPSFSWTPELGLSCTDCPNPVLSPYTSGVYTVTASIQNYTATCYGYATLQVEVSGKQQVFIPDAFSPNGDGNNDVFRIYGDNISEVELKVFNRWGELVYESTNALAGWDGTYKGQVQSPGVFTYDVLVTLLDNTVIHKSGSVTLVR